MLRRNHNASSSASSSASALRRPHCFEMELADFGEEAPPPATTRVNTVHMAQLGAWLFESRRFLPFSLPSLYLAVSLLEQLRTAGFAVEPERVQLLGATVLLLSSKFNEIEQLGVQKLNERFGKGHGYSLEQFREMEGEVLEALGFALTSQRSFFLRFCDLHERFLRFCPSRVENYCKICLQAPDLQRFGSDNLLEAIAMLCERNRGKQREAKKCVRDLMGELEQLENSNYL